MCLVSDNLQPYASCNLGSTLLKKVKAGQDFVVSINNSATFLGTVAVDTTNAVINNILKSTTGVVKLFANMITLGT
jgi:ribonucleotide reductase alpha subunit